MLTKSFGFIGGGRVDKILLHALKNRNSIPGNVIVSDINDEVLQNLQSQFTNIIVTKNNIEPAACDYVFISLHPPVMGQALEEIKNNLKPGAFVISLAPKFSINKISSLLGGFDRIVRMIPNAPSYINKGYNPVAYSGGITEIEKKQLGELFRLFGDSPEVDETNLEAYAIITAMGPTYFWYQLNELHKLGKSFGLSNDELTKGITAMIKGTVDTMYESGLKFEEVTDLIPVKPMAQFEKSIADYYSVTLNELFKKLKS